MTTYIIKMHQPETNKRISRAHDAINWIACFEAVQQYFPGWKVETIRICGTDKYVFGKAPPPDPRIRCLGMVRQN